MKNISKIFPILLLTLFSISCDKDGVDSSNNYLTIVGERHNLTNGFYEDYGNDDGEYNMELYISNMNFEQIGRCDGDCDKGILIFLDLYGPSKVTVPQTYRINGYTGSYADVEIYYGNSDDIILESGTVTVEGDSMGSLKVTIEGIDYDGNKVNGSFNGAFQDIERLIGAANVKLALKHE